LYCRQQSAMPLFLLVNTVLRFAQVSFETSRQQLAVFQKSVVKIREM
jgi:hypothetical protein